MGGYTGVVTMGKHILKVCQEMLVDFLILFICNGFRFNINALAKPEIKRCSGRMNVIQVCKVLKGAFQVCLDNKADILRKFLFQLSEKCDLKVGTRGIFHIDPHKIAKRNSFGNDLADMAVTDFLIQKQTKTGRFEGIVPVNIFLLNPFNNCQVGFLVFSSLVKICNEFTQQVNCDLNTVGVKVPAHFYCIINSLTCNIFF